MAIFSYKAITKHGDEKQGTLDAPSYQEAISILKTMGLYPTEVFHGKAEDAVSSVVSRRRGQTPAWVYFLRGKIKARTLVPFISDLAVLLDSGISLLRALSVLKSQTTAASMKQVITDLQTEVEGGQSLSEALSRHPYYFSRLFINMVCAGEVGGMLSQTLDRLASLYEKNARLEARLKAALTYPLVVLTFALGVVIFMVAFIVPKFFVVFSDMGIELPQLTMALFQVSTIVRTSWPILIGALVIGVIGIKLLTRVPRVQYLRDVVVLHLPVFGMIVSKVSIARFCRTFGTLLGSGVPILQTLSIAKDAAGNQVFQQVIDTVRQSIKEGESVAGPLSHYPVFPPLVTNMIAVGEESGILGTMLIKIANRYDEEVDTQVSQLASLLEPFLIVGMGLVVAFIVIALFLPLVSIVQGLTNA